VNVGCLGGLGEEAAEIYSQAGFSLTVLAEPWLALPENGQHDDKIAARTSMVRGGMKVGTGKVCCDHACRVSLEIMRDG
jgi:hypothetical protein